MTKVCPICNKEKDISKFRTNIDGSIRNNDCMSCRALRERSSLRLAFLEAFGSICECCGETDPRFLTLDHKNNDGNIHRQTLKEHQIVRQAKNEGWPRDKYQCLCFNCNSGRSVNGGLCPHKCISKEEYIEKLKKNCYKMGKQYVNTNTSNVDARVAGRQLQALLLRLPKENADAIRKLLGR